MNWSQEHINTIQEMWAEGYSAAIIGRNIDRTRSAVLGKLRRLGVPTREPDRPSVRIAAGKAVPRLAPRKRKPKSPKLQPMKVEPVYIPTETIPFRDWKLNQCAFIAGEVKGPDTLYCGSRAAFGSSWCRYHIGIVWAGIPPKKDRLNIEAARAVA